MQRQLPDEPTVQAGNVVQAQLCSLCLCLGTRLPLREWHFVAAQAYPRGGEDLHHLVQDIPVELQRGFGDVQDGLIDAPPRPYLHRR
ncbi:hypothetical protein D3C73_1450100 [compost metagenome]